MSATVYNEAGRCLQRLLVNMQVSTAAVFTPLYLSRKHSITVVTTSAGTRLVAACSGCWSMCRLTITHLQQHLLCTLTYSDHHLSSAHGLPVILTAHKIVH